MKKETCQHGEARSSVQRRLDPGVLARRRRREKPASDRAVATGVLALNSSMLRLYDESLEKFKQNMRDRVPIILALFTGQAGR